MTVEALQDRMLSAMRPDHKSAPPARWQQRKSAQTRLRLVEAGIDCLVEGGYAGLTTSAVAERCAVSRGAMHHHFATRLDLVAAVVEHVFYQRMRHFLADYFAAMADRGEELLVEVACEAHWRSVQTREYAAYVELAVAARTDAELEARFTPAARQYDEVWTREMIEAFPQWQRHWEDFKVASDFTLAAHMGLLLHRPVFGDGERLERIRRLTTRVVQKLYEIG
ncbi:MAG: TetR/AcrR family transcriptional regulator [Sphingomonadales bacterium]|nr:TetR/AcrR family transcriptional regulator [Sphingomonadales bacterium]